MKIENRDPAITPVTHNSGSMRPAPSGPHHDPRSGGEIPVSQYQPSGMAPGSLPIKNGGSN
jgi:hypothetical protein